MKDDPVGIGIVGCGVISDIYLKNLTTLFREVHVLGVCDTIRESAQKKHDEYNLPKSYDSYEDMLNDTDVELILDLCPPAIHYQINKQALLAGKHVYTEKPLCGTFEEANKLCALATERGLTLCSSPDTVLGAAIQTGRKLADDGVIGSIVGCSANLIKRGVETWHPNPFFLYQKGAGPLWDMGPYYINTLLQIMGRIKAVSAMTATSFPERIITSQPHYGETIHVDVETYVNALLRFESGAVGNLTMTFDVHQSHLPFVEIYGAEGSISVPDPNLFGGEPILLYRPEDGTWKEIPFMFGYADNSRGLGLADACKAIRRNRKPRAGMEAAVHTVEIMESILKSAEEKKEITLKSSYERPAIMQSTAIPGILDE